MGGVNFINVEYIFLWIYRFFTSFNPLAILQWLIDILALIRPYALILAILLILFMIYCWYRLWELHKKEEEIYGTPKEDVAVFDDSKQVNTKWLAVEQHVASKNPSDWRQAILECDIMLADVLTGAGYHGDSIGDQLKSVDPANMRSLNAAWDAHKVRNQIAHEGSDFQLNEREAKRVVDQYKKVFKEFDYI